MRNDNQIRMEAITTNKPKPIVVEQLLAHILRPWIMLQLCKGRISGESAVDTTVHGNGKEI